MKPSIRLALFHLVLFKATASAMTVHEWGTFTVLFSSSGHTPSWYQPFSDAAHLPLFAQLQNPGAKSIGAYNVRMETPVLYFYPENETEVTVNVSFAGGMITERFPPSQFNAAEYQMPFARQSAAPPVTTWKGKLLPPGHAMSASIPPVPEGTVDNYAAARAVPDAWLFASDSPVIRMNGQPDIHPVDKFIFYRGAANFAPPWLARLGEDRTYTLIRLEQTKQPWAVALQVRGDMASWKHLAGETDATTAQTTLPHPDKPVNQAIAELSELFLKELTARGLTRDEALAMIRTWDDTWFSEQGQRIFTIADPAWVDRQLPLEITPKPQNISRVFVVRCELLEPHVEQQLAGILLNPDARSADRLKDMHLGRFANGAVEIAAETVKSTMRANHQNLLLKMAEKATAGN